MEDLRLGRGGMSSDDVRRWPVAQRFAHLARELAAVRERLVEKEEQIEELKSERANTRVSVSTILRYKMSDFNDSIDVLYQMM